MKYIACLCGGFSISAKKYVIDSSWTQDVCSDEERRNYENYYLPEFVRFQFCHQTHKDESMIRYTKLINQCVDMGFPMQIDNLKLYVMPFDMVLFAIQIEVSDEDINRVTKTVLDLRNLSKLPNLDAFTSVAISPIVDVYKQLTDTQDSAFHYSMLVENGNKLKIFQIICSNEVIANKDAFLFELGTFAPIGSYDKDNILSTSEEYFNKIMSENKLSVFNNWACLSLADTVTILGENIPDWLVKNWIHDYFGLIYIWQLFRKNYIFRLTKLFRYGNQESEKLLLESVRFERKYSFNIISYNFLPEAFAKCVEKGLNIEDDKRNLYHILEQEEQSLSKKSDSSMNYLLFFMTCLTIFSAVYDACSLLNEILPYETNLGSSTSGYRFFSSVLMLFVLSIFLFNRFKRGKKE